MSTTAQKLTYLNDTKGLLKDSINSLGGEITSQTTFRQYATELDSIYSNLPKVSGTGSNISLTPTLKGRLGSVLKGNTLQDGTPTPDSPVDIQSATGLQKVSVKGKNLYKVDNIPSTTLNGITYSIENGVITLNGTATSGFNITLGGTYDLLAGTYTLSTKEISGTRTGTVGKYVRQGSTNVIDGFGIATTRTVTLSENYSNVYNYLYIANGAILDNYKVIIQLEKGSTATDYEPYQSQTKELNLGNIELKKIGDYQDYITGTPDNWSIARKIGIKTPTLTNSSVSELYMDNTTFNGIYKEQLGLNKYLKNVVNTSITDNTTAGNRLNNNEFSFRWGTENYRDRLYIKSSLTLSELQSLNLEIYYVLATETTEAITNQEIINQLNEIYYLQSYNGTTNITITSEDLELIMTASAIKGDE